MKPHGINQVQLNYQNKDGSYAVNLKKKNNFFSCLPSKNKKPKIIRISYGTRTFFSNIILVLIIKIDARILKWETSSGSRIARNK